MLLAIDTATRVMSIALHDGHTLLSEQSWHTGNRHTVELIPAIQQMLATCDVTMAQLTGLGVSVGPGSYTGLRIGVAAAKGLATARGLPVVGQTTLDTLASAQPYHQSGTGLVAVVQAGRGRIIVQTYRRHKGHWQSRTAARLMDWEALIETIDGPAHITGEIDEEGVEIIQAAQAKDKPVTMAPPAHRLRRAGFLAEDAWRCISNDKDAAKTYHPNKLAPIYLKSEA